MHAVAGSLSFAGVFVLGTTTSTSVLEPSEVANFVLMTIFDLSSLILRLVREAISVFISWIIERKSSLCFLTELTRNDDFAVVNAFSIPVFVVGLLELL